MVLLRRFDVVVVSRLINTINTITFVLRYNAGNIHVGIIFSIPSTLCDLEHGTLSVINNLESKLIN